MIEHTKKMNAAKFITFTIQNQPESLEENHARLRQAWRNMRQQPTFKERCKGGIYAIETTRNPTTGQWHSHIHIIADCNYIPQRTLANEWTIASGGSFMVWIEPVHDSAKTAAYLADYIAKPADMKDWDPETILEFADATKGKRLIHTFGTHHNVKIDDRKDTEEHKPKRYIAPLRLAAEAAEKRDPRGELALKIIQLGPKKLRLAAGLHIDKFGTDCKDLPTRLAQRLLSVMHDLFCDYCGNRPFGPHGQLPIDEPTPPPTPPPPPDHLFPTRFTK